MSDKNSSTFNANKAIKEIRRNEKASLLKLESDARLAIREAVRARERQISAAKEAEIKTLREMQQQFDNSLKNMREANRNKLKEINDTLVDKAAEARNLEKKIIREAYDEESLKISGSDKKNIQKIKYETLQKIQQARYNTEKAIDDALFEEKHTRHKFLDMAYRDIVKEEESQNRTRIRTINNARNTRIKAINDAESNYRKTVLEIRENYHNDIAGIRKQSQLDIQKVKQGLPLAEHNDNKIETVEEKQPADKSVPEAEKITLEDSVKTEAVTKEEEAVLTYVEGATVEEKIKEPELPEDIQLPEEAVKTTNIDIPLATVESSDDAIKEGSNVQAAGAIAAEEEIVSQLTADIYDATKPVETAMESETEQIVNLADTDETVDVCEHDENILEPVDDEETSAMESAETIEPVEEVQTTPMESAETVKFVEIQEELVKKEAEIMAEEPIDEEKDTESLVELANEVREEVITYKEAAIKSEEVSGTLADYKPEPGAAPAAESPEAPAVQKPVESEELFSGIVRIAVKSPAESHRIKMLGDELNKIDKVRMLFIGGEVNKDTVIHIKLDAEMTLIDVLKGLPDVADVSVKNKNIQLTLKTDK